MHFHVPKPLHGWREFSGEVGVIVIGVLIALGAEQLVERFHRREQLRDAEGAMVSELRDDDLPQAFACGSREGLTLAAKLGSRLFAWSEGAAHGLAERIGSEGLGQ